MTASRSIARELRERMGQALEVGSRAVVLLAFLAVFRESIETAFIVYASAATATTAVPFVGVQLGLARADQSLRPVARLRLSEPS